MNCPECDGILAGKKYRYTCEDCGKKFDIDFTCEICGETPEIIPGCGAVNFFCKSCNTLKSRESMNKSFSPGEQS